MAQASRALDILFRLEGGYSDHPSDVGGRTMYGIAAAMWPNYWDEWGGPPNIGQAEQFYINEFWNPLKLDSLADQGIANEVFEEAVNLGKKRAIRFWQLALCLLGYMVDVDGVVGPETLNTTNMMRNSDDLRLVKVMNGLQFLYYLYRTDNLDYAMEYMKTTPRSDQDVFFRGWMNRIGFD
jgi:lysozyme family protein